MMMMMMMAEMFLAYKTRKECRDLQDLDPRRSGLRGGEKMEVLQENGSRRQAIVTIWKRERKIGLGSPA